MWTLSSYSHGIDSSQSILIVKKTGENHKISILDVQQRSARGQDRVRESNYARFGSLNA